MTLRQGISFKRLLIVDDEDQLLQIYRTLFESQNYTVTTASNGAEAVRHILKADFDVILCDLMMPHLSGDMFYLAVQRVNPQLCDRFIFVTGYSGDPHFSDFLKNTPAPVLSKPATFEKLVDALASLKERLQQKQTRTGRL